MGLKAALAPYVLAVAISTPSLAVGAPAVMLQNLEDLKAVCAKRKIDKFAGNWCFTYIVGHIDAALVLRSVQNLPGYCVYTSDLDDLVSQIIAELPDLKTKDDSAALYVQSAIAKVMTCKK